MDYSKRRFFIALLPPQEVQEVASQIQHYFAEVYQSKAALKSPPHITLQPPFEWEFSNVSSLEEQLQKFSQTQFTLSITLDGFAAFKPRVIYMNVLKMPDLLLMQKDLMFHLESELQIVDPVSKSRPYTPHLTVAFRDLTKPNFHQAWAEFQTKELYFEFSIDRLTLLIHNGKMWEVHQQFLFNS